MGPKNCFGYCDLLYRVFRLKNYIIFNILYNDISSDIVKQIRCMIFNDLTFFTKMFNIIKKTTIDYSLLLSESI